VWFGVGFRCVALVGWELLLLGPPLQRARVAACGFVSWGEQENQTTPLRQGNKIDKEGVLVLLLVGLGDAGALVVVPKQDRTTRLKETKGEGARSFGEVSA